jgi:Flagellar hook-length control protein FliK
MSMDTPALQPLPQDGGGLAPRWADDAAFDARVAFQYELVDPSRVTPQLAQDLAPLPDSFSKSPDATAFADASRVGQVPDAAPMDQLSVELRALVEMGAGDLSEACSFHLDIPGLGRLNGRLAIRGGQAQLELSAARQGVAASLRSRQHELKRSVDQSSRGEVNLFIV